VEQGRKRMFLSEVVIVIAIAAARDTGKELLIPPMDIYAIHWSDEVI